MSSRQKLEPGSCLYFRGEKADRVWFLVSGRVVEEYREGDFRLELPAGPGSCLGVLETVAGGVRAGDARCLTAVELELWSAAEFLQRFAGDATLMESVLGRGIALLQELNDRAKRLMAGHGGPESHPAAAFFAMGDHYEKSGRPHLAQYIYRRYGELFPDGPDAAAARAKTGTLETAVAAVALDALDPEGLLAHGKTLEDQGDFAGAVEVYKKLMMMEVPDPLLATGMLRAAHAYLKVGKPLLGLKVIKRYPAGKGTPDEEQQAPFVAGCIFEALGETAQARKSYEQCANGMWAELAKIKLAELKG